MYFSVTSTAQRYCHLLDITRSVIEKAGTELASGIPQQRGLDFQWMGSFLHGFIGIRFVVSIILVCHQYIFHLGKDLHRANVMWANVQTSLSHYNLYACVAELNLIRFCFIFGHCSNPFFLLWTPQRLFPKLVPHCCFPWHAFLFPWGVVWRCTCESSFSGHWCSELSGEISWIVCDARVFLSPLKGINSHNSTPVCASLNESKTRETQKPIAVIQGIKLPCLFAMFF